MKVNKKLIYFISAGLIFVLAGCSVLQGDQKDKPLAEKSKNAEVELVRIKTKFGDMVIWLFENTPIHKENFIKLAKEGFYDFTTFHRVIKDFMIQGGDPNSTDDIPKNDGQGGPGYTLEAEIDAGHKHLYGSVAAARMGDAVNPERRSSGSQFYIVHNKSGTPHLDGQYTVFGEVIEGKNIIDSIANTKLRRSRPVVDVSMQVEVFTVEKQELKTIYNYTPPALREENDD